MVAASSGHLHHLTRFCLRFQRSGSAAPSPRRTPPVFIGAAVAPPIGRATSTAAAARQDHRKNNNNNSSSSSSSSSRLSSSNLHAISLPSSAWSCSSSSGGGSGGGGTAAAATTGPMGARRQRSAEAEAEEVRQDAALRRWIQDHGGFVHEAISITSATQCGARGLVASQAISLTQLEGGSLVVVPRGLHMNNNAAVAAIGPRLGSAGRQEAFGELGQVQQVAFWLAAECSQGHESFWLPYLRTLPDTPPNPWLLSGPGLAEVLEAVEEEGRREAAAAYAAAAVHGDDAGAAEGSWAPPPAAAEAGAAEGWSAGPGGDRAGWAAAVEAARRRYCGLAEEAMEVVGPDAARRLGVDQEGLMWAMGQVVSRSLGSGRSSGLLPFIDMANHDSASRPPMMMLDDTDRLVFAVTNIRGGEVEPMEAGQELFISYQPEGMSPLQAWLKWGFVPRCLAGREQ